MKRNSSLSKLLLFALAQVPALGTMALLAHGAIADENVTVSPLPEVRTPSPDRQTRITGDTVMRSSMIDEAYAQSRSVGLGADLNVDHRLSDNLTARLSVGLNLDTGSSQNTFTDEYKPVQGVALLDAYLNWSPIQDLDLRGGAINQGWLDSPLLVGNKAFPAAMAAWKAKINQFYVQLAAEGAIPTSDTTNSVPRGNDPLPSANFERVSVGMELTKTTGFEAHVGHFAFSNLPSGVALESRYRGNSVTGVGDQGSSFIYDFSGIETGANAKTELSSRLSAKVDASWLTNLRAPLNQSRGMLLQLETAYLATPNMTLAPSLELFRSESDSSPAYYNTSALAHNNRQGLGAGLRLGLAKEQLDVQGSWVNARVIQTNPFQSDFNGVVLSLRKSYDLL